MTPIAILLLTVLLVAGLLVLAWFGHTTVTAYRRDIAAQRAKDAEEEGMRKRIAEASARLTETERRLFGGDAP